MRHERKTLCRRAARERDIGAVRSMDQASNLPTAGLWGGMQVQLLLAQKTFVFTAAPLPHFNEIPHSGYSKVENVLSKSKIPTEIEMTVVRRYDQKKDQLVVWLNKALARVPAFEFP